MGQSPRSRWEGQPLLSGMWNEEVDPKQSCHMGCTGSVLTQGVGTADMPISQMGKPRLRRLSSELPK